MMQSVSDSRMKDTSSVNMETSRLLTEVRFVFVFSTDLINTVQNISLRAELSRVCEQMGTFQEELARLQAVRLVSCVP